MKTWQTRSIGVLTFGGSVIGCALMAFYIFGLWPNLLAMTILSLFAMLFAYGVYLGVQILRGTDKSLEYAIPFWIVQIPIFTSSYISFNFNTGGAVWLSINADGIIRFFPFVGSYATLNFGVQDTTSAGVNLLAVAVVFLLLRHKRSTLKPNSVLSE